MKKYCRKTLLCGALVGLLASPSQGSINDLIPLQKGYVVATCHSNTSVNAYLQDPNGFVVAIIDGSTGEVTAAPTGVPGVGYNWRRFHNEQAFQNPGAPDPLEEWTAGNMGEVFGITIDDAANPNIYVSATTAYGVYATPAGNSHGSVYKIDGTTGDITPFNCINAGDPSLGNLTYSSVAGGNIYVTNFDDGMIYQLDCNGVCLGTYDHGVMGRPNGAVVPALAPINDDPSVSWTQVGRRVWGIEAHEGRLYYGVWNTANTHAVWSVALDPGTGNPLSATAQIEITGITGSNPVSDIAFSQDGRLFLTQRYHRGLGFGGPHNNYVIEYTPSGPGWVASPLDKFKVGNHWLGRNSAGGVDVECTGAVWASGDALNYPSPPVYGITRIPAGGNQADIPHASNSHIIDLDDNILTVPKRFIGDVEIYDPCEQCFDISDIEIKCPDVDGAPYQVTFKITNRSDQTAHYIWYNPCDQGDLPAGAFTGQPTPIGPHALPTPLATGDCTTVTLDIPAPLSGGKFCWNITLLDETGGECCTDKYCIDLPDCDCFIVVDKSIVCEVNADGTIKYTLDIKIQNTSGFDWHHVNLLPPTSFTNASFNLSASPVPNGAQYDIHTCVIGNPGDLICFSIAVHSEDIEICCSKECCLVLPECDGVKPDECNVTRVAVCCPDLAGLPPGANSVLTICNNSPVSRTYSWNMAALPVGPGCNAVLPLGAGAFSPGSGTITVGPNSCVNIPILILCEGLQPGQRACYEACVRQVDDPSNRFCCDGRVFVPENPDPAIKPDPNGNPDGVVLIPNGVVRHTVAVSNPSDRPVQFVFEVRSLGDLVEISSPNAVDREFASLRRLRVDLEPFETEIVSMDLRGHPSLPYDNTVHPILVYPLSPEGSPTDIVHSFSAIAPLQQAGAPALQGIAQNGDGTFTMVLSTRPGRTYRIESSQTLGSDDAWGPVTCSSIHNGHAGTEFVALNSTLVLIITPDPTCPHNFFRAIELP